jgi:hypothetical protein
MVIVGTEMKGRFQWRLELEIQATPDKVWETVDDISMIPQYLAQ